MRETEGWVTGDTSKVVVDNVAANGFDEVDRARGVLKRRRFLLERRFEDVVIHVQMTDTMVGQVRFPGTVGRVGVEGSLRACRGSLGGRQCDDVPGLRLFQLHDRRNCSRV